MASSSDRCRWSLTCSAPQAEHSCLFAPCSSLSSSLYRAIRVSSNGSFSTRVPMQVVVRSGLCPCIMLAISPECLWPLRAAHLWPQTLPFPSACHLQETISHRPGSWAKLDVISDVTRKRHLSEGHSCPCLFTVICGFLLCSRCGEHTGLME